MWVCKSKGLVMSGLEQYWVRQNPEDIKIFDSQFEWKVVKEYIGFRGFDTSKSRKITRLELKNYLTQEYGTITSEAELKGLLDLINHSFFLLPNQNGGYDLAALARSKPYTYQGNTINEGVLGYGSYGRVNPCRVKDSSACTEDNPGQIFVIKVCAERGMLNNSPNAHQSEHIHEVLLMRALRRKTHLFVRNRKGLPDSIWFGFNKKVGKFKTYIVQPMVVGKQLYDLHKNNRFKWSSEDKLQLGLSIAKALKELHDVGIIHRDIHLGNFLVMEDLAQPRKMFLATLIDLGLARKLPEGVREIMDPIGHNYFTAPEGKRKHPKYSLSSDIFALGLVFKELGIDQSIYSKMLNEIDRQRPTIDQVISIIENSIFNLNAAADSSRAITPPKATTPIEPALSPAKVGNRHPAGQSDDDGSRVGTGVRVKDLIRAINDLELKNNTSSPKVSRKRNKRR